MRVSTGKIFNLVACVVFLAGIGPATAQDCGCDVVIAAGTTTVDGAVVPRVDGGAGVRAGDKVCLMAGSTPKRDLLLKNFVGSAAEPLLITNCGGQVVIGPASLTLPIDGAHRGLRFMESRHFVLSGQGDPAHAYGIYIRGTASGVSGVSLGARSEHFLVESLEVSHTGFAGIMSKTDPACDGSVNRGVWTQHETYFRDNYIHDVGGEGLYIGSTAFEGYNHKDCNGDGVNDTLYPHLTVGVAITGNRIERTQWDGLQLGSAPEDAEIADNTIDDFGLEDVYGQSNGIQVGAGTTGWVHRNVIRNGKGNGILMAGDGDNFIVNNLIVRPDGYGIYIGNWGADPGEGFYFYNNTIVGSGDKGLQNFNDDAVGSEAYNNLIVQPGRLAAADQVCMSVGSTIDWTASNNLCALSSAEVAALEFVDAAGDDYRLGEGSTAVDAGLDLTADGVTVDLDGAGRPQGATFDVGAYERGSGAAVFQQDFQGSTSVAAYVHATAPNAGQFNDIGAEADGGAWSIQQGRLQLVRTGSSTTENDAGITRFTDFAGSPSVLHVAFDLGVSAWTASQYQTGALLLSLGSLAAFSSYGNGDVAANTFQTLSVNGKGPGRYAIATAGAESAQLDADGTLHRVSLFLNKSGAAAGYRAPDGTLRSLRADGVALWVDTTPVVVDGAATNGSSSALTDLRARWTHPENATWMLDNWVVRSSFPQ